eukprot:TRINITY_DN4064_c0_g2_i2.p1 TRINITY_DN4064_c0_g2~~TRINITY_DN4064_c0_g2_i2.p1  ORF type:complete len:1261 (+),score=203.36 TRINITY_DN4064_c0_g2_i2:406-3783(+)
MDCSPSRDRRPCDIECVPCVMGFWSEWGPCDRQCGGGQQKRIRDIISYGNMPCDNTMESRPCNTISCDPCAVSEWSDWGMCSGPCGSVVLRNRTRTVLAINNGQCPPLIEYDYCRTNLCDVCSVSDWSAWSTCDQPCDGGNQTRSREITSQGQKCPFPLQEVRACNMQNCVPYVYSNWTDWSPCVMATANGVRTCGIGTQTRTRTILKAGQRYTPVLTETRVCDTKKACDCEVGGWDDWSECTRTCGGGTQTRNRYVVANADAKGQACPALQESKTCNTQKCDAQAKALGNKNQFCLRAMQVMGSVVLLALPVDYNDKSSCSLIRFTPLSDDFTEGRILSLRDTNTTDCLAYTPPLRSLTPDVGVAKTSVLSVTQCDPLVANQRFLYNQWTLRLKAKSVTDSNPVIFMWWKDGLKAYQEIPEVTDQPGNFGWAMPTKFFGPVTNTDSRGFSGRCWKNTAKGVFVDQSCSRYLFQSFEGRPPSTYLSVQISVSGRCVTYVRTLVTESGKTFLRPRLTLSGCQSAYSTVTQRFVLELEDSNCETGCKAHLRWAGDPRHNVIWQHPVLKSQLVPHAVMTEWTDAWLVNWKQTASIQRQRVGLCWGTEQVGTTTFVSMVSPANATCLAASFTLSTQNHPYGQHVIQQFEADSVSSVQQDFLSTKQATSNDLFFADLGESGMRRLQPVGTNFWSQDGKLYYVNLDPSKTPNQDSVKQEVLNMAATNPNWKKLIPTPPPKPTLNPFVANMAQQIGVPQSQIFVASGPPPPAPIILDPMFKALSPGSLGFPFVPNRLLETYDHGFIQVGFITIPKNSHSLIFSFRHMRGCEVFITPNGNLGMSCAFSTGNVLCYADTDGLLHDGNLHFVGLVYSTKAGLPSVLFVDGQAVVECATPENWDIRLAASRLSLFWEPGMWRYVPRMVGIRQVLLMANDRTSLIQIAGLPIGTPSALIRNKKFAEAGGFTNVARTLPVSTQSNMKTSWTCTAPPAPVTQLQVECQIKLDSTDALALQDAFPLACSRPGCTISTVTKPGPNLFFNYLPHYPAEFISENVGSPPLFPDVTILTDGATQRSGSFNIKYSPDLIGKPGFSKLELTDVVRYQAKDSCCWSINDFLMRANNLVQAPQQDDIF